MRHSQKYLGIMGTIFDDTKPTYSQKLRAEKASSRWTWLGIIAFIIFFLLFIIFT